MRPLPRAFPLVSASVVAVAWLLFAHAYRPWARTWGATDVEVRRPMIGDDVVRRPTYAATRAITIEATPAEIWPWIVQMGYGRAGFYSWDGIDNNAVPSAERIIPEYQDLQTGDLLRMSGDSYAHVAALKPAAHLLLVFEQERSSWAWELHAVDARRTRLVTRLRIRTQQLRSWLVLDVFEIVMTRRHLLGIKRRAEAQTARRAAARVLIP